MFIQPIFKRPGIMFIALFVAAGSAASWLLDLDCQESQHVCTRERICAVPPPPPMATPAESPDFGPFMAGLQRQIKRAWFPPKKNKSNTGRVYFSINRDGSMQNLRITHSTGFKEGDIAMIHAVQNAAPFHALPEGAPATVDIDFNFDYNVFNGQSLQYFRANGHTGDSQFDGEPAPLLKKATGFGPNAYISNTARR